MGSLLYDVATKFPEAAQQHRALVIKYVVDGKLNRAQLAAALRYFKALGKGVRRFCDSSQILFYYFVNLLIPLFRS